MGIVRTIVGWQRGNGLLDFPQSCIFQESGLGRHVVAKIPELNQALGWDTDRVRVAVVIVLRRDFGSVKSY